MNTISNVPPPTFQSVPTHSPLGKPVVGIEAADAPLPPVEESTATDELRQRDVIAKLREDDARREQQGSQQDQSESEQSAQKQLEEQLTLAAQTAVITPLPAVYQAKHLTEFEPHSLPPGSLLDQQV